MFKIFFTAAWRNIVKNKSTTFLNVSGLLIGVVVCMLIGVWLQRELSFDNFHPNGNKIFRITNTFKSESETFSQALSGVALGARLPKVLPAIKAACRVISYQYEFKAGNNQFFEPNTLIVDSNFFSFFGFRLVQGQPTQVLRSPNQIVLSEKAALKYFGSSKEAIGKTMMMQGQSMTVAGIAENAPYNSHLQYDVIVPYIYFRSWAMQHWKEDLDDQWIGGWPNTYVQLYDPLKWKEIEKQINSVVAKFSEREWKENKFSYQYFLQPIREIHLNSNLRYDAANNGSVAAVRIFSMVGIVVLLLACINYVNLTTSGAIKRAKEVSVRKVMGATRLQLARQFFLETFIICLIAVFWESQYLNLCCHFSPPGSDSLTISL
jgi:putative ABC transport system permease protein